MVSPFYMNYIHIASISKKCVLSMIERMVIVAEYYKTNLEDYFRDGTTVR